MASRATNLSHLKQERIVIAIDESAFHFLKIARFFALLPKPFAGTAIVMSLASLFGPFPRLFVHVGDHQNFARPIVLDNDRNKSVAFRKIDVLHNYRIPRSKLAYLPWGFNKTRSPCYQTLGTQIACFVLSALPCEY